MKEIIRKLIPNFFISWYHLKLAFWGAVFYGFPSRKIKVIGVTGTNGKSTVVCLTTKILEQAGFNVASLSSIKFKVREKELPNDLKMTMPGRFKLQKFLRQAVKAGCQYVVLEVTSEGIKQHRHRFIDFNTAVFTNLFPEHIEAHGSFEKYKKAKRKLFRKTKNIHIVNLDDENTEYFLNFQAEKKWRYGLKIFNSQLQPYGESLTSFGPAISNQFPISNFQTIIAKDFQTSNNRIKFSIKNTEFNLKLLGKFNIYNSLAAICVGLSQGVNLETCKKALEKVEGIPGRMEVVIREPFTVIVDYAHTPDSLRKVYKTIKESGIRNQESGMICVLGACGGGRDKWKRPELGSIAGQYCDQIILTNEDPYNENPMEIIEQVTKGVNKPVRKILDRREAIREALKSAKPGGAVIITGKGCEPWMCVEKNKKIPWDEREIVKQEFTRLNSPSG